MRRRGWLLAVLLVALPFPAQAACVPEDCTQVIPLDKSPLVEGDVEVRRVFVHAHAVQDLGETKLLILVSARTDGVVNFTLPLPPGAVLTHLNLTTPEGVLVAKILDNSTAKPRGGGGAQVTSAKPTLVRVAVDSHAGMAYTFQARYLEWVPMARGHYVYRFPLHQLGMVPEELEATFQVEEGDGVEGLRFPRLPLGLYYQSADERTATYRERFSDPQEMVAVWRAGGGPWHGTMFLAPPNPNRIFQEAVASLCYDSPDIMPRDIAFVIDQSGSMTGPKIEQAREALRGMLLKLDAKDAYTMVRFNNKVIPMRDALTEVTPDRIASDRFATSFIRPENATNISGALEEAFLQMDAGAGDKRIPAIFLLTDGFPTDGITDAPQLLVWAEQANVRPSPIHVVPIGLDAAYSFLKDLGSQSGGTFTELDPANGALPPRLERLFDLVARPQMTNVSIQPSSNLVPVDDIETPNVDRCIHTRYLLRVRDGVPTSLNFTAQGPNGNLTHLYEFPMGKLVVRPGLESLWAVPLLEDLQAQTRIDNTPANRYLVVREGVAYQLLGPNTTLAFSYEDTASVLTVSPPPAVLEYPKPPATNATFNGTLGNVTFPGPGGNATSNGTSEDDGLPDDTDEETDKKSSAAGGALALLLAACAMVGRVHPAGLPRLKRPRR